MFENAKKQCLKQLWDALDFRTTIERSVKRGGRKSNGVQNNVDEKIAD
jgi:hypothetical protein